MDDPREGHVDPAFHKACEPVVGDPNVRLISDMIMQLMPQLVNQMGVEPSQLQAGIFVQAAGSAVGTISAIEQEGVQAFRDHPEKLVRLEACLELTKVAQLRLEEALALIRKGSMQ